MKVYQRYYQLYHTEIFVSEKPEHISGIICYVKSKKQSTETDLKLTKMLELANRKLKTILNV